MGLGGAFLYIQIKNTFFASKKYVADVYDYSHSISLRYCWNVVKLSLSLCKNTIIGVEDVVHAHTIIGFQHKLFFFVLLNTFACFSFDSRNNKQLRFYHEALQ